MNITMQPVISSQIEAIGFDEASRTMAIRFQGGSTYHYSNVEPETFTALQKADSIGSHFYKHIKPFKDKYPFKKMEPAKKVESA